MCEKPFTHGLPGGLSSSLAGFLSGFPSFLDVVRLLGLKLVNIVNRG